MNFYQNFNYFIFKYNTKNEEIQYFMGTHRIKQMKPKRNSMYHNGVVDPKSCHKYVESCKNEPAIYRSGLELQFMQYCENNPGIVKWASEPLEIPYISRLDGKKHTYNPDFVIQNKSGNIVIVEIKPSNQTKKPNSSDSQWLKEQWIKNCDKWAAAKEYAQKHSMKFIIVTEKFFN